MAEIIRIEAQGFGDLEVRSSLQLRLADSPEPSRAAQTESSSNSLVPPPLNMQTLIEFAYSNPWLGALTNLLTDAVASSSWELRARETDTDGGTDADDTTQYKEAYAWLARENVGRDGVGELSIQGLLSSMAQTFDRTGNIFVEIIRNKGMTEPMHIVRLNPRFVQYDFQDSIKRLYQSDPYFGEHWFVPFGSRKPDGKETEFLHERVPNDISSFYGIPVWFSAKESVEIDNEHRKYLKGFFKNHGTPRYLIHVTQDPAWTGTAANDEHLTAVKNHAVNFLQGNAGAMAGRNLILKYPGGIIVKAEALDHKIDDPTFPNTGKAVRDEILAVRHISLINLGLPEGGYRATAEEQSENFRKEVLEPFAQPAVNIINKVLHAPKPYGLGLEGYDFAVKFERVAEVLKRFEGLIKATGGAAIISQREARPLVGYEARGSDDLLLPIGMVPAIGENPDETIDG